MAQTGDDCYFYYYSTCAKGDTCPFRHQPAAKGCEITCNLWERGTCFKKVCTFRHMVIEKDRSTIPCLWESQPSGCMKPYCPFMHTKPKNTTVQSIPTLGAPRHPGNPGRGGPGPRPLMYNSPPRPAMPPTQRPYMTGPQPMQQRPMGYDGFIPHSQPSHPMMYQMHHNTQSHMGGLPYPGMMMPNMMAAHPRDYMMPPRPADDYDDSDDDYTSSDYSDVSISDDERRGRSRESSRRRVQSPRHTSSRREVKQRSDKRTESRSSRESYNDRKSTRRRYESDKDKNKKDSERTRTKPRKESENKESSSSERKKSESSDEKPKSETEEKSSDIKIKTLEEILREKALKNLHERTALKKKAQMEADKAKKEGSDDSPEPILKSVVSVSKAESTSSQKVSESRDPDPEVEFIREKKVKSPKTIILDIIDPEHESSSSKTLRQVKVQEDKKEETLTEKEEKPSEEKDSKPTPSLTNIKVKTFEEIMEEKRQRKAQESKEVVEESQEKLTEPQRTGLDSKLSRKIIVVKKDENKKESNPKLVVKRKVLTTPKKGIASGVDVETKEKEDKKPEKKTSELKERPNNIVIKSFDEIMREKRQRKQEKTQPAQQTTQDIKPQTQTTQHTTQEITPTTTTTTTTVKRPTIIRSKQISTTNPRSFKTRKLKVIGRQGASSSNKPSESVSEPASPSKSSPQSPTSPKKTDLGSLPSSCSAPQSPTSPTVPSLTSQKPVSSHSGNDSDDDDSWENEDLPAVPLETPTLEGPARIPGIPTDDTSVLIIPGKVVQPSSSVSPTKRPRSSLEELFGVPCDNTDTKPDNDDQSDDEERNVSPPKRVKTQTYDDIVQAVNSEMSKKDDFDLDLEEEIANLPDKHSDHGNDTLNEDDLLLELEEMINN